MIHADRNDRLLRWYEESQRDLPWRRSSDPYEVLVSEVMLQQTQVERVIPKFEHFMGTWSTVEALASAETDDLLRAWSGLGYNTRAIRLRESGRMIVANGWPDTLAGLKMLPGVGPYTASAIGSIAFGMEVPATDTNVRRILSRWAGEPLIGRSLDAYASECLGSPAGDWNQSLMDLGSTICSPSQPKCSLCPVASWCADPSVYEPPPKQTRFEGSHRQLRGALLRAHLAGKDLTSAGQGLGRSLEETTTAIDALKDEGLI
ncbi:MAG: A/G-specific adenine glycosylase [Actinomycetota bacterium]